MLKQAAISWNHFTPLRRLTCSDQTHSDLYCAFGLSNCDQQLSYHFLLINQNFVVTRFT